MTAVVVDNRFGANGVVGAPGMISAPGFVPAQPGVLVSDQYGGWMRRTTRGVVFGLLGFSIVLGLFLPGIIMMSMRWSDGIRTACTDNIVVRALTTCCVFIFHALIVIPLFISGDRAHSVVNNQSGIASYWRTRTAHTAAVLQVVGNLIELALLAWTAVGFWNDTSSGNTNFGGGSCASRFPQFNDYMWAMLIGGMAFAVLSLITIRQQYTSAALRDSSTGAYAQGGYAAKTLSAAP